MSVTVHARALQGAPRAAVPSSAASVPIIELRSGVLDAPEDAPVTVVVVDSGGPRDLVRALHQVTAAAGEDVEVAVASLRRSPVGGAAARRVRVLHARSAEALDELVAAEFSRPRTVLVASSSVVLPRGWLASVRLQVSRYPTSTSSSDGVGGGLLLVPPALVSAAGERLAWDPAASVDHRSDERRSSPVRRRATRTLGALVLVEDAAAAAALPACLESLATSVREVAVVAAEGVQLAGGAVSAHRSKVHRFGPGTAPAVALRSAADLLATDWLLWLHGDEVLEVEGDLLQLALGDESADLVRVEHVVEDDGSTRRPLRIGRRTTTTWTDHGVPRLTVADPQGPGSVHRRAGGAVCTVRATGPGSLLRSTDDRSTRAFETASAQLASGLLDEALASLEGLRADGGADDLLVEAARRGWKAAVQVQRLDEARAWAEVLDSHGAPAAVRALHDVPLLLAVGDVEGADRRLAALTGDLEEVSTRDAVDLERLRISSDTSLKRFDRAEQRALALLATSPESLTLAEMISIVEASGSSMLALAQQAPAEFLSRALLEGATLAPADAITWYEAHRQVAPSDTGPVIAGNVLAPALGWRAALTWSERAHAAGLGEVCALAALGHDASAPVVDRCVALALRVLCFADDRAREALRSTLPSLSPATTASATSELRECGVTSSDLSSLGFPC